MAKLQVLVPVASFFLGGGIRLMYFPPHVNPIIKLTESCNYSCYFCRYANHRQQDNGICVDHVKSIIFQCVEYNRKHGIQNMNIIFHGGEPLLYGMDRLKEIMNYEKEFIQAGFTISNSIQTNSSLLNDEWIDFLEKNHFSVGISLDGPIGMNGHVSVSPEESEKKALTAYHKMKSRGMDCGFLSVITQKHLNAPADFLNFFLENDIASVGLCYCFNPVDNENVDPIRLGEFLIKLYDLYFVAPKPIYIREFDMVTRFVLNRPRHECAMSCRQSCGSFLTITPNGNVEFCDDYSLDRSGTLGNINVDSILDMIKSEVYQMRRKEALQIVSEKCKKCPVFNLCKSGCMRNDYNGSNYFCETFKMLYPHIQKTVQYQLETGVVR